MSNHTIVSTLDVQDGEMEKTEVQATRVMVPLVHGYFEVAACYSHINLIMKLCLAFSLVNSLYTVYTVGARMWEGLGIVLVHGGW